MSGAQLAQCTQITDTKTGYPRFVVLWFSR